jgi:hypothetical protein
MFKKYTKVVESKKKEADEKYLLKESNLYLDFSKKYNKEQGVSGPFDKKFKGDKAAQKKYMQELSDAWEKYKEEKGIKTKSDKKFAFAKGVNESKAMDMASQMIGDGGDPNYHFVSMCDDYMFEAKGREIKYSQMPTEAPLKIKTTPDMGKYVFGPFLNIEESKLFADSIELDEINGPRMVTIEDRKSGKVYCKHLTCKLQPVWEEHIDDDGEYEDDDSDDSYESPNSEYTYSNEDE